MTIDSLPARKGVARASTMDAFRTRSDARRRARRNRPGLEPLEARLTMDAASANGLLFKSVGDASWDGTTSSADVLIGRADAAKFTPMVEVEGGFQLDSSLSTATMAPASRMTTVSSTMPTTGLLVDGVHSFALSTSDALSVADQNNETVSDIALAGSKLILGQLTLPSTGPIQATGRFLPVTGLSLPVLASNPVTVTGEGKVAVASPITFTLDANAAASLGVGTAAVATGTKFGLGGATLGYDPVKGTFFVDGSATLGWGTTGSNTATSNSLTVTLGDNADVTKVKTHGLLFGAGGFAGIGAATVNGHFKVGAVVELNFSNIALSYDPTKTIFALAGSASLSLTGLPALDGPLNLGVKGGDLASLASPWGRRTR